MKVKVIEIDTNEELFSCPLDQISKAYQFYEEMTEIGLNLKLITPSTAHTLANSLGIASEQIDQYINDEIEGHNNSCCTVLPDSKK